MFRYVSPKVYRMFRYISDTYILLCFYCKYTHNDIILMWNDVDNLC
jgi:hypothetical protein